jgi:hypothetical protein
VRPGPLFHQVLQGGSNVSNQVWVTLNVSYHEWQFDFLLTNFNYRDGSTSPSVKDALLKKGPSHLPTAWGSEAEPPTCADKGTVQQIPPCTCPHGMRLLLPQLRHSPKPKVSSHLHPSMVHAYLLERATLLTASSAFNLILALYY